MGTLLFFPWHFPNPFPQPLLSALKYSHRLWVSNMCSGSFVMLPLEEFMRELAGAEEMLQKAWHFEWLNGFYLYQTHHIAKLGFFNPFIQPSIQHSSLYFFCDSCGCPFVGWYTEMLCSGIWEWWSFALLCVPGLDTVLLWPLIVVLLVAIDNYTPPRSPQKPSDYMTRCSVQYV
ncbi:hypothetical protein RJT34_03585 [Clitoria ternatea]|uniref:Uncharacterized protein n=1 Tax=Clitoria ternatea TaxID=43366 RepID=A0AAN9KME2_CLITE